MPDEPLSRQCLVCGAEPGEQCRTGGGVKDDPLRPERQGAQHYPVGQEHAKRSEVNA